MGIKRLLWRSPRIHLAETLLPHWVRETLLHLLLILLRREATQEACKHTAFITVSTNQHIHIIVIASFIELIRITLQHIAI